MWSEIKYVEVTAGVHFISQNYKVQLSSNVGFVQFVFYEEDTCLLLL